jgi:excisionase family DNA binding protein
MALPIKKHYRPDEVARFFRYSVSFIYQLVRVKELQAETVRGRIRIPRVEACRAFCQGTGDCPHCTYARKNDSLWFGVDAQSGAF